jgi:hypothetical protein
MNDCEIWGSYDLNGHVCIKSDHENMFVRIGPDGCELEKLRSNRKLIVEGIL